MWSKKISKLSILLLLIVLVQISSGETTSELLTTTSTTSQELNGDAAIVDTTTIAQEEAPLTTNVPVELKNITESSNTAEDINNTQPLNNAASSTELPTEASTDQIECVCDCIANGNQVTLGCSTQTGEQTQTETSDIPESTTSSNNESTLPNVETYESTTEKETSTLTNNVETTSELNNDADTATQTTTEPETTTASPSPICSTPGVQAHELDCQQYYDCSLEGSEDGNFHLLTKSCPGKQAFNIELNRCSRDISSCSLTIQCLVKGGIADPTNNSSYYLCEPRLIGTGFRVFHIDCASNEIFYPNLGKCFVDFNNLPTQGFLPPYNWNQIRDIDIVKAELKLLKEQDKLVLKQEKDRKKAEEKLQKELEKEAKRKAKEEEKANKEIAKQQAASVVCQQEGNIASEIGDTIYYACISKKGKLKAIPMQCSFGATFNPETGSCINNSTGVNRSVSEDDDDDD